MRVQLAAGAGASRLARSPVAAVDFFGRFELDSLNLSSGLDGGGERVLPVGTDFDQFLLERFQISSNGFLFGKKFFAIGRERDDFALPKLHVFVGLLLSRRHAP